MMAEIPITRFWIWKNQKSHCQEVTVFAIIASTVEIGWLFLFWKTLAKQYETNTRTDRRGVGIC